MTKSDFLAELSIRLNGFSREDIAASLAYYNEMIDDRIEDGASEEEAVAAIGTPAQAAAHILEDMPLGKLLKVKLSGGKKLPTWAVILLIVGSPIWIALLASIFSVVISLFSAIWSVIISLCAAWLAFAVSPLAGIFLLLVSTVQGNLGGGLVLLGVGCMLGGLSIFLFKPCLFLLKGGWFLTKKLFLAIKRCFIKKEAIQ